MGKNMFQSPAAYLERPQDQVKHQTHIRRDVMRHKGEDYVVHSKQGNQK